MRSFSWLLLQSVVLCDFIKFVFSDSYSKSYKFTDRARVISSNYYSCFLFRLCRWCHERFWGLNVSTEQQKFCQYLHCCNQPLTREHETLSPRDLVLGTCYRCPNKQFPQTNIVLQHLCLHSTFLKTHLIGKSTLNILFERLSSTTGCTQYFVWLLFMVKLTQNV